MEESEKQVSVSRVPVNAGLTTQPRTELGVKLLELRDKYISSGGKLYTADEINDDVCARRS